MSLQHFDRSGVTKTRTVFRICPGKTLESAFNGQAAGRLDLKLTERPPGAPTTRSSGNSRGSVDRWVFAEVERDLISGAHSGGALPWSRSSVRKLSGPPERAPTGRLHGLEVRHCAFTSTYIFPQRRAK